MTERNIVYKPENTVYQFECKNHLEEMKSLADYTGQVLLIVNTASECGFTPQYGGLEKLHQDFHNRGFSVLGFPCNQFGNQEPGAAEEISEFCQVNYGVSFTMFDKIEVNGSNTHPIFKYLKSELGGILGSKIKWNFTKWRQKRTTRRHRTGPPGSPRSRRWRRRSMGIRPPSES